MLLLSGFSTGYLQAAPYAATTGMYSAQQNNVCTGIVVDQNGETVIGASLVVKGTTNGTITGLDGDFSIPNVENMQEVLDEIYEKCIAETNLREFAQAHLNSDGLPN